MHDAQHLVDPVGREIAVEGGAVVEQELGVEPVNQRLVRLATADEVDAVIVGPRPHLGVAGGVRDRVEQCAGGVVEEREQRVEVVGTLGLGRLRRIGIGEAVAHDRGPEQLHLGEMPEQIGRVPIGARLHPPRSIRGCERGREPGRFAANVPDEIEIRGHRANVPAACDIQVGAIVDPETDEFLSATWSKPSTERTPSKEPAMPHRDSAPAGAPCWVDLFTSDPEKTCVLRRGLRLDVGIGRRGVRRLHQLLEGRRAGRRLHAQRRRVGCARSVVDLPRVNDAQATVDAAAANGGQVELPPMPVMELGTMAFVIDPGQGRIGVWQPGLHKGFGVLAEPGAPSWFELHTRVRRVGRVLPQGVRLGHARRERHARVPLHHAR